MKTPEETKNETLVAQNASLEENIGKLSNVENTYKLKAEEGEQKLAAIDKEIAEKQEEKTAAEKGAEQSVATLKIVRENVDKEISALNQSVVDKTTEKKKLDSEVVEINGIITVATSARITTEELLAKAQADHKAFMTHAESEKARITDELKQLDDTAKAQVVVIQSQSTTQTFLDEQILTKKGELAVVEDNIEIANERYATVTTDVTKAERDHAEKLAAMVEESNTVSSEIAAATTKAKEELVVVEADLETKRAQAIMISTRGEQLDQKELYLKDKFQKAGIPW